ncbi:MULTISPECIES: NAD(P)H-binding protein [unclassified Chelatococcus]|uniref:NAD(P)H-binding protein n=1 Tax=unclassified Chelatococcus TaxID=2638111 RepID=UPI001BCBE4CD|nr:MULTISPECIES: NAD(P)H-binding protein [unclassified Chelatococcus]CAH1655054.1 Semialdhyde_dh domain-containing protein [Hyphomicrobiales bacterium]MBS7742702.1 NAD(P)H-binding protein [Chelatococcus sp. HY11]MBX3542180.1 NAD(P)H-binding protein [Chelatococcus sp.]MCO5075603.1 NAD(P)H-binding protein [Chelatococcus sp.]CAH1695240.1 Semialdhyde_dh domain-containing protein [Hyphomicrobiales bacterium]
MIRRVLLAGSTGLVGKLVNARLAERPDVDPVCLVRQGSAASGHAIDYEELCREPEEVLRPIAPDGIDAAISCLGTTIRAAGSQPAMFRVDHDYVLAVAKGARALGARQFILMTAAGAGGPGFYLQTKGAIEQAVAGLGFERVDLIRPGFLLGNRSERRVWEAIGQNIFAVLTPVLLGPLSRYGAIPAETVADAIVALIGVGGGGRHVHENRGLRNMSAAGRALSAGR